MKLISETETLSSSQIMTETNEILDEKLVSNGASVVLLNGSSGDSEKNLSIINKKVDCGENKENVEDLPLKVECKEKIPVESSNEAESVADISMIEGEKTFDKPLHNAPEIQNNSDEVCEKNPTTEIEPIEELGEEHNKLPVLAEKLVDNDNLNKTSLVNISKEPIEDSEAVNCEAVTNIFETTEKCEKNYNVDMSNSRNSVDVSEEIKADNDEKKPSEIDKTQKEDKDMKIDSAPEIKESEINIESEEDIVMEENAKPIENESNIVNLEESSSSFDFEEKTRKQVSNCENVSNSENNQETVVLSENKIDLDRIDVDLTTENQSKETVQDEDVVQSKTQCVLKLSNTLDILSDDEDGPSSSDKKEQNMVEEKVDSIDKPDEKQCINIEDDDDIMLIDDDTSPEFKEKNEEKSKDPIVQTETEGKNEVINVSKEVDKIENDKKKLETTQVDPEKEIVTQKQPSVPEVDDKKHTEVEKQTVDSYKPLVQDNFLQTCKKNLTDMTKEDLEELCILKIVESIVDRSNLSEIKTKIKTMAQTIEEFKKKTLMLTKQNRDLQVVLKSVQEEQKKMTDLPITPLKITRSVGMQVLMSDSPGMRRKAANAVANNKPARANNNQNQQNKTRPNQNIQQIPVPRLVPALPASKTPPSSQVNTPMKINPPVPNGVKFSQVQKSAEKRPATKTQSVTVDLTDDEPPAKAARGNAPVRLVSPQNLMANPRAQFPQNANNLRKVYIPISGPQNSNARPQSPAIKSPPVRSRSSVLRMPQNTMGRITGRHPAPLPETVKQYQRPNWKALPPAPDLKLSKVENGIVISWKIEGYQEDSYEEIASYQLYAYQETHLAPSTSLWKKIGDVKALPLPMACTLTQFMAGFKYYFAVRAVDVRSRLGPFSLPGSILLLNKI